MTEQKKPKRWWGKATVLLGLTFGLLIGGFFLLVPKVGGDFESSAKNWSNALSPEAKKQVEAAYAPFQPGDLIDVHTHIVGLGAGGTGAKIHEDMASWLSPVRRAKFEIYLSASGVDSLETADQQYVSRLLDVATHVPQKSRHFILAFDANYHKDGTPNFEHTEFYVPNDYVFELAGKHPDLFTPAISVHPYRKDAVQRLEELHKRGARLIKWLPNAMGIDPADPKVDPFYDAVVRLNYTILTHAGEEQAVEAEEAQELGNPLRLRRGLDKGVRFVVAHCASLGEMEDLDNPGQKESAFNLFIRLMDEPKYKDLLWADISAIAQFNRVGPSLLETLKREDLHPRFINGSDYPLPAINALIQLGPIENAGLITAEERDALVEIYRQNPLMFDFVLKRTLKHPDTGRGFAHSVFTTPTFLKDAP